MNNMTEQLKQLNKQIEVLQKEQEELILEDNQLSKIEKLKLIDEYSLFSTEPYIQGVFKDVEENWAKELKIKYPRDRSFIFDDFIIDKGTYSRYETINLLTIIESIVEDEKDNGNCSIEVLTVRGLEDTYTMTTTEVIEHICDWCLTKKCIEFTLDW
jgi:hypothetical protein